MWWKLLIVFEFLLTIVDYDDIYKFKFYFNVAIVLCKAVQMMGEYCCDFCCWLYCCETFLFWQLKIIYWRSFFTKFSFYNSFSFFFYSLNNQQPLINSLLFYHLIRKSLNSYQLLISKLITYLYLVLSNVLSIIFYLYTSFHLFKFNCLII